MNQRVLLTTKYGRDRLIKAKIGVAFSLDYRTIYNFSDGHLFCLF